jgi:tetratricopeptide (TPR) repeat protein
MPLLVCVLLLGVSASLAQSSIEDCPEAKSPSEYVSIITSSSPQIPHASVSRPGTCNTQSSVAKPEFAAGVVRVNALAAPKKARKAYERAARELARKKPDYALAARQIEVALQVYPSFAEAWDLLGQIRYVSGEPSRAIEALEMAIRSDATYLAPYLRLAIMAVQHNRMEDAIQFADRALKVNPASDEAHYFRAVACHTLDRTECASESTGIIIARGSDRKFPRVHLIAGDTLAARGDLRSAAKAYGRVIELEPGSRAAAAAAAWIANVEKSASNNSRERGPDPVVSR